ncbi:MAG: flavodoxin family protein [Candidatus Electrothrix aestuarii]|uniref:Flavodoxin family protein n=1 Tax=Candidatus Electrothrix aestuarii TaxID=3062594 RepID=A0AAU8M1Q7_9BACT|nr:flavodoxin family protein [Candidatus Electrothrix aestuarii]
MTRILAINGSYRAEGFTDQAVDHIAQVARSLGAEVEIIHLRDVPIEFCRNCRSCTQQPGSSPGHCIQHDAMPELLQKIEQADGFILASPTNFGSITALFKRFMERLVVYGYWPWGQHSPKPRQEGKATKKAVLISSSAAPALMGLLFFNTIRQLKTTAKTIGAQPVDKVVTGLVAKDHQPALSETTKQHLKNAAKKLVYP